LKESEGEGREEVIKESKKEGRRKGLVGKQTKNFDNLKKSFILVILSPQLGYQSNEAET
jgi:hypothetical protein